VSSWVTRPRTSPLPKRSAPSVLRWPRACHSVADWNPTRPRSPVPPWPTPAPTLSCSGLMFAGWFGVDRHTSQVGICARRLLFDALGEGMRVLDGRRGPRVQ